MPGILDHLEREARDKVSDPGWVEDLVDAALAELAPVAEANTNESAALLEAAEDAGNYLKGEAQRIAGASAEALAYTVGMLSLGLRDEARRRLTVAADLRTRLARRRAGTLAVHRAHLAREAAWDDLEEVAWGLLERLGKAALPLLLAGIGL